MSQSSRSKPRAVAASACWGERLLIPWTTSTALTPLTVRSRVTSNPCSRPAHCCPAVKIAVARSVRFSVRPCPLSTVVATRSAGGGGTSSGGSGRRDTPGGVLEGEPGPDVGHQARLVVLGDQQVLPP